MMRTTGCDGVVIGRGCLGRPWLFRDLADVFEGREPQDPPCFGEVSDIAIEHATLLSDWAGESAAMRMFRRHSSWYTKGFRGSAKLRSRLMRVTTLAELVEVLRSADASEPFPPEAMRVPRGKTAGRQKVSLPEGFLENRITDDTPPVHVDAIAVTGG
jgi:tRNA-dihydrouridine synthase